MTFLHLLVLNITIHYIVDAASTSSSETSLSSLDSDVRTDLELQLQKNLADITRRYASYASHILTSIKLKGISVTDFRSFLLNLTAFQPGCKEQCKLMSAHVRNES